MSGRDRGQGLGAAGGGPAGFGGSNLEAGVGGSPTLFLTLESGSGIGAGAGDQAGDRDGHWQLSWRC